MKKAATLITTLLTLGLIASQAAAHSLWINAHESFTHPPGHVLTSLGWGHQVPMDDFLMSDAGAVSIIRYDLVGPDGSATSMDLPVIKKEKTITSKTGMTISPGDLGLRKIALTKDTRPGTYAVTAESKATFFTGYVDANGKHKMATKPMDEIKDAKSFDFSTRYKAVATTYIGIKEWTKPTSLGHDLELMPETDLSQVKAGDIVPFTVTLKGQPVTSDMDATNFLHMTSNTYGGPDRYMLAAYILDGKAQIRVPTTGEWVASVIVKKDVRPDNELKHLVKKCQNIYYGATVSFNARP
ncbi:MAG: DUF4198 domain-containing protein [Desulfobacter sp.]